MSGKTPGQAAYEASLGFINATADGTPWAWDTLPTLHREAWEAAAAAAIETALTEEREHGYAPDLIAELNIARAERDALRALAADPLADVPPPELVRLLRLLDLRDIGSVNYDGYRASSGSRSLVSGEPLPEWDAQSPEIRRAWQAGAEFVVALIADSLAALAEPAITTSGTEHLAAELADGGR
jgi:hypothetical protein